MYTNRKIDASFLFYNVFKEMKRCYPMTKLYDMLNALNLTDLEAGEEWNDVNH